jgi:hypothetical protein
MLAKPEGDGLSVSKLDLGELAGIRGILIYLMVYGAAYGSAQEQRRLSELIRSVAGGAARSAIESSLGFRIGRERR